MHDSNQYEEDDAGFESQSKRRIAEPGLLNMAFEIGIVVLYLQCLKIVFMPNPWAVGYAMPGLIAAFVLAMLMMAHASRSLLRARVNNSTGWRTVGIYSWLLGIAGVFAPLVVFVFMAAGPGWAPV